jgi:glycogen debranching enzyme
VGGPGPLDGSERAELRQAAIDVLDRNRRRGTSRWGGRRYDFVCPSPSHYPFQWLWDSCFHAIALCRVDPAQAAQELRGLIAAAQPDGFIPHMILWEKDTHAAALASYNIRLGGEFWTATIQPPVLAQALERVFETTQDRRLLEEQLPPTLALYNWLRAHRDPDNDGLISIIQPDESGLDASPKYDSLLLMPSVDDPGLRAAMERLFQAYEPSGQDSRQMLALRLFDVEDVLVNSIYIQGLRAVARLCRVVGATPEAHSAEQEAARASTSLFSKSWDAERGAYWDLRGPAEKPLRTLTITSLMPLILPNLPREHAQALVQRHLLNRDQFWLEFPLPSVAADEPSFDPEFRTGLIWRGPTWVNTNWFLVHGLRLHGYPDEARELADRTLRMVLRSGFREFFNPATGQGYGAASFGWTTLVLDLLDRES